MKVNKEELVGMLAAVERFVNMDHAAAAREYDRRADAIRRSAASVPGVAAEIFVPVVANHVPHVRVAWKPGSPRRAADVVRALQDATQSIAIRSEGESLVVGVWMMEPGEDRIVVRRLRQELDKRA